MMYEAFMLKHMFVFFHLFTVWGLSLGLLIVFIAFLVLPPPFTPTPLAGLWIKGTGTTYQTMHKTPDQLQNN